MMMLEKMQTNGFWIYDTQMNIMDVLNTQDDCYCHLLSQYVFMIVLFKWHLTYRIFPKLFSDLCFSLPLRSYIVNILNLRSIFDFHFFYSFITIAIEEFVRFFFLFLLLQLNYSIIDQLIISYFTTILQRFHPSRRLIASSRCYWIGNWWENRDWKWSNSFSASIWSSLTVNNLVTVYVAQTRRYERWNYDKKDGN